MKKYRIYILLWIGVLAGGCVQEDINEALRREAELDYRIGVIRTWCEYANEELKLLHTILNLEAEGDCIERVDMLADGSGYTITFQKNGVITIKNGVAGDPGKDGEDGKDGSDGKDGVNGTDGKDGEDGKDGADGSDGKDGADGTDGKDGQDGAPGADGSQGPDGPQGAKGDTPMMGVAKDTDGKYYWTVKIGTAAATWMVAANGEKLPAGAVAGQTPRLGIGKAEDGKYYWQCSLGTGIDWIYDAGGQKVAAGGIDGKSSIFRSVNTGHADYVEFVLADGTVFRASRVQGLSLEFDDQGPLFFRRGSKLMIAFNGQGLRSVEQESGVWAVALQYTEGQNKGSLTVTAPEKGSSLPACDRIVIKGTDALGNIVRATVSVTLYYRFEMPLFNASSVYDLLINGHKVGEICREYLAGYSSDRQATVVYPYDMLRDSYGEGLVWENGAKVKHDGSGYSGGVGAPYSKAILTEDGSLFKLMEDGECGVPGNGTTGVEASFAIDGRGYHYRVVKIGTQYWMAENLKTLFLNDGTPIPTDFGESLNWMIQCGSLAPACQVDGFGNAGAEAAEITRNTVGVLYNRFALDGICPEGWHIPSLEEADELLRFVGYRAGRLKMSRTGIGGWLSEGGIEATNVTGFSALSGNRVNGSNGSQDVPGSSGKWWTTDEFRSIRMNYNSNTVTTDSLDNQVLGEANSVRCVRNKMNN